MRPLAKKFKVAKEVYEDVKRTYKRLSEEEIAKLHTLIPIFGLDFPKLADKLPACPIQVTILYLSSAILLIGSEVYSVS